MNDLPVGSRIGLALPSGPRLAELLLACWDLELVAVPRDPADPQTEHVFNHAQVHAVITENGIEDRDGGGLTPGLALLMYTSGSTGSPKGVMLSRAAVEHNARAVASRHGFDIHATGLSLHHCNAVCGSLLGTYLTDADLCLIGPGAAFLPHVGWSKATTAMVVPAQLEQIVRYEAPWPDTLRYLVTAAAPLSIGLARRFEALYGPGRLVQGYGLTEAVNFSLTMPDLQGREWLDAYVRQRAAAGVPLDGSDVKLVDGEIWVTGPGMMDGYWRNSAATAERVVDGWVRTGDQGEQAEHGIRILGRVAEGFNWRGAMTYPGDIEERWDGLAQCVPVIDQDGAEHPGSADIDLGLQADLAPAPMAVDGSPLQTTSTGKPCRRLTSAGLVCQYDPGYQYAALQGLSVDVAWSLQSRLAGRRDPQVQWVVDNIKKAAAQRPMGDPADAVGAGAEMLREFHAGWSNFRHFGMNPISPDLWQRLMNESPMGPYGELVARVLDARGFADQDKLEFGHGTGNTARHLNGRDGRYVRTDISPKLAPDLTWNIDEDLPEDLGQFDAVFGTNVLHCAEYPVTALSRMRNALRPEGILVIGEGLPETGKGIPWAFNYAFGLYDGWWDRGGFKSREEWARLLRQAGFSNVGWSVYRAGRADLGGVIWAYV